MFALLLHEYIKGTKWKKTHKCVQVTSHFVIVRQYLQHISVVQKVCYRVCKSYAHHIAVNFCYFGVETRKWHSKRNCPYPYSIPMNFHISSQLPWFSPFSLTCHHNFIPISIPKHTKFCRLYGQKGNRRSGIALTDISGYPPMGSRPRRGTWALTMLS